MWSCLLSLVILTTSVCAQSSKGYNDPNVGNGSMLLMVEDTWPAGMKEPINIIISGKSDKRVLNPSTTDGGLYNYFEAFRYGGQCLGLHMGYKQVADLGDGMGNQTQINMLRYQYFGDIYLGTCVESIFGGGHFRLFYQNNSNAYFLASSAEADMRFNHALMADAFDLGRDYIVGNVTGQQVDRNAIQPGYNLTGSVEKRGWRYTTIVDWDNTLLKANRTIMNHYVNVQEIGGNVTDGYTAILTVKVDKV